MFCLFSSTCSTPSNFFFAFVVKANVDISNNNIRGGIPGSVCQLSVFEDKLACVTSDDHAVDPASWSAQSYLAQDHVAVRYFDSRLTLEDEDAVRLAGGRRQVKVTVPSFAMVPQMLAGTALIATVPDRFARAMASSGSVRILPFPFKHRPLQVLAYWHPSRNADRTLIEFVATLGNDRAPSSGP